MPCATLLNIYRQLLSTYIIHTHLIYFIDFDAGQAGTDRDLPTHLLSILFFRFELAAFNVFNFFSISVSGSRQTHDLCIFELSQTFNYTLLKYGSLLNRSPCFCFTKHRALYTATFPFLPTLTFNIFFIYLISRTAHV